MNVATFESVCRKSGFTPLQKRVTPSGCILLAERNMPLYGFDRKCPEPHHAVLWGIERDGCDMGRIVYCKRLTMREERIQLAVDDALEWIKDNRTVGRY